MTTCAYCGNDVTGKKFCPECGKAVEQQQPVSAALCPQCGESVKAGTAFCNHCGAPLRAQTQANLVNATQEIPPEPTLARSCPACHAEVSGGTAFCINCGHNLNAPAVQAAPAATPAFCTNCGQQNAPGVRFCASCGSPMGQMAPTGYAQPGQYPPPPQYGQPYAPQPYPQQQYGQPYQQQPMVLRCPICMAMAPMGTASCPSCHTSLAGVVPTPANLPQQGQQGMFGNLGGMMQGNAGKYAMGALGGAAAVVGGEMLLHGVENVFEGDRGYGGYGYEHRHREEGMLGELGELGNDIGLF